MQAKGQIIESIDQALIKNEQASDIVEQAAHELALVHAILEQADAPNARPDDVALAVAQTQKIETELTESVELMQDSQQLLQASLEASKVLPHP